MAREPDTRAHPCKIRGLDAEVADPAPPTRLQLGRGCLGRGVPRAPAEDGVSDSALPSAGLAPDDDRRTSGCLLKASLSKALAWQPI
jgi:hypothetical protein